MPRFYLDVVEDGVCLADREGLCLDQLAEAEVEASFTVAEMMTNPQRYAHLRDLEVVIRDAARAPVARVSLTLRRERMN
jgi:hypothetical protein